MTSIATLQLWIKGILWLRLFSATSFYIRLISETLKDITTFMIILLIFLTMFANCIYILDLYRQSELVGAESLAQEFFEDWNTINTLFNQYLLALGEFGLDSMTPGSPNMVVAVVLFIAATFLT